MADDDRIKLGLDLEGFDRADEAGESLGRLNSGAGAAGDGLDDLRARLARLRQEMDRLTDEAAQVDVWLEHNAALNQARAEAIPLDTKLTDAELALAAAQNEAARAAEKAAAAAAREDAALDKEVAAAVEATRAQKLMRQALEETAATHTHTAAANANASAAVRGYGQNVTALSYVVNDFMSVQGGLDQRLNAIANNLPMLLAGFGGLGAALSGIVPIIAAVIRNWDEIKTLWEDPAAAKATVDLRGMEDALKGVKKELEEAARVRLNSVADLERYNELVRSELALEEKISKEKQEQERIKKFLETKPEDEEKAAKEAAKVLRSRIGGRPEQQQLIDMAMAESPTAKRDAAATRLENIEAYMKRVEEEGASGESTLSETQARLDDLEQMRAEALAELNKEEARRQREAQELVRKAVEEGDASAIGRLREVAAARAAKGDARALPVDRELYRATPKGRQETRDANEDVDALIESQIEEAKEEKKEAERKARDARAAAKHAETERERRDALTARQRKIEDDAAILEEMYPGMGEGDARLVAEAPWKAAEEKRKKDERDAKAKARTEAAEAKREAGKSDKTRVEEAVAAEVSRLNPDLGARDASAVAARMLELQRHGAMQNDAYQEAMREQLLLINDMIAEHQQAVMQANAFLAEMRRMGAEVRGMGARVRRADRVPAPTVGFP